MADTHLKSTLQQKCTEIELRIEDYRRRLAEAQSDLVHVNATIAIFSRDNPTGASEPSMSLAGVFKRGEAFGLCVEALRSRPNGLDTRELATFCLQSKSLDHADKLLHRSMMQTLAQIMQLRGDRGQIVSTEKRGLLKVWRLP